MADISMCQGTGCPLKNECYRHTAPVNEYRQAYFVYIPYDHAYKGCEYFSDNRPEVKHEIK
jgi:hypothetical protein